MSSFSRILLAAVIAGLGFLAGISCPQIPEDGTALAQAERETTPDGAVRPAAAQQGRPAPVPRPELAEEERATISLFERASPSVVYVTSLARSEEHTSELQSRLHLVCRLLLEKKKKTPSDKTTGIM